MLTVNGVMDALFPTLRPEQQSPLRSLMAEQSAREEAFIAEHIAKRTPELVRQYALNPDKIDAALLHAARKPSEGMRLAVRNGDEAELGRLLRVRMNLWMHDQAKDTAELEAQELLDTQEVMP